ncbi:lytic transglycosylase domain-containing protein [Thermoclostridium stercorarium]|uniref:lytic transglycosylase domain-containing protein n=1 Tax=Thermoclostridium stercorarium TaxID=1510 RepID=UPI002092F7F8|nr:lytic transglycosylase domain-containing protein [Thermoclostridium stercorarium]
MFPTPHLEIIEKYARDNQIKITMVYAVMKAESGFKTRAVSPKGAIGLMQITESTGRWIASELGINEFSADQLADPELNIRFGCWYLAYLLKRFNGNSELALAAYNAGEGTVSRWLDSGNIGWENSKIKYLPYKETEKYLVRVNRIYFVYKTLYPELDSCRLQAVGKACISVFCCTFGGLCLLFCQFVFLKNKNGSKPAGEMLKHQQKRLSLRMEKA